MSALRWVSSAFRPLSVEEVKTALAIHPEDQIFDEEGMTDESLIVSVSAGLVAIDHGSGHMVLAHFTVSEFFNSKPGWLCEADSFVTESCLTYWSMDFSQNQSTEAAVQERFRSIKWADLRYYATFVWGLHAARGVAGITEDSITTFLLNERRAYVAGACIVMKSGRGFDYRLCGLHVAAFLGLKNVLLKLIAHGMTVNCLSALQHTPLALASAAGKKDIVEILLARKDVNVNLPLPYGGSTTPIMEAVLHCQETIIRRLLQRNDLVADVLCGHQRTPLSHASERGNVNIVKLLLQRDDVQVKSVDEDGFTALCYAARFDHADIAELLLRTAQFRGEEMHREKGTALLIASKHGSFETAKFLLQLGPMDTSSVDKFGRSALSYAAAANHARIFELLLKIDDFEIDSVDNRGKTPLWMRPPMDIRE